VGLHVILTIVLIKQPLKQTNDLFSGSQNWEIGWPIQFEGLVIEISSYFGADSATKNTTEADQSTEQAKGDVMASDYWLLLSVVTAQIKK
jgi:hypothetical protein